MNIDHISLDKLPTATKAEAETNRLPEHPPMISLVFRNGSRTAFAYSHLYRVDFNGSDQITMHLMNDTVILEGKELGEVMGDLTGQVRAAIVEQDPLHVCGSFISKIEIVARQ